MNDRITRREVMAGSMAALAAGTITGATHAEQRPIPPELLANPAERKYELGMVTYNIAGDWDLPTLIARAKELRLAAVELRTTHKHGVEVTLTKPERGEVKKRLADSGIKLWSLGSTCEYHSPDPAVLTKNIELTEQFIQLAVDVGAKMVKVRPNGLPKEVAEEKTLEQIGRSLHGLGPKAADAGVRITCEMHGSGTQEPWRMRRIMEIADHPAVGVTWNCNGSDAKDGSVREAFESMRKWIYNVHINELINGYPYREFFTLLRTTGYTGYTMMEIQNFQTKDPDPKDVMRFLGFYKALWEELTRPR